MQESIVFLVRVQCRRKESSRSLSHLLVSFLYIRSLEADFSTSLSGTAAICGDNFDNPDTAGFFVDLRPACRDVLR